MGNYERRGVHCFQCNDLEHYAPKCTRDILGERFVQGSSAPKNGKTGRPTNLARSIVVHSEASIDSQA